MYHFILGFILGAFTVIARDLHRAGTVRLKFRQWLMLALVIVILAYISHRFIKFDLLVSEQFLGFSFNMFILPIVFLFLLLCAFCYVHRRKKMKEKEEKNSLKV